MRYQIGWIILLFITGCWQVKPQDSNEGNPYIEAGLEIPKEGIYILQNASLFLAGEELLYAVYCLDLASNNLSTFSKIAYVELVGDDLQPVFRHKIVLEQGRGAGDFFIPSGVPTGSYKLIGYTQWMKNSDSELFFKSDIRIINPYKILPGDYAPSVKNDTAQPLGYEEAIAIQGQPLSEDPASQTNNKGIYISVNKEPFKKRALVSISIHALDSFLVKGNYSLSVRKIDDIEYPKMQSFEEIFKQYPKNGESTSLTLNDAIFLPELRGELLSGRVIPKANSILEMNKKVAISLPGKEYFIDIANTNKQGIFYFILDKRYENTNGVFQVIDDVTDNFRIVLDTIPSPTYDNLLFDGFRLGKDLEDIILKRSIHNQIENAYKRVKSDTISTGYKEEPFYRNFKTVYPLDDYTRFNTLNETIIEVIDHAWIDTDLKGKMEFRVRSLDQYGQNSMIKPLVIMDGLIIQDHKDIIDYPARKIKTVSMSRDRIFMGSKVFQGILAFETLEGNFNDSYEKEYLDILSLFRPQPPKKYFIQTYQGKEIESRIPDFRRQLFWKPDVTLEADQNHVEFFTSDIEGEYEIRLEGITKKGRPISCREHFTVR